MQACIHANKCLAGFWRLLRVCASLHRHGEQSRTINTKRMLARVHILMQSSTQKFVSCKHALTNCAERRSGAGHAVPDVCASVHRHPDSSMSVPVEVFFIPQRREHSTAPQYECKLALIHGDAAEVVHSCFCISASLHWCRNTAAKHGDALV
jgi:hypothetical protein